MKDEVFHNTSRTCVRVFLIIAAVLTVAGSAPLVVLWVLSFRGGASADTRHSCFLAVCLIAPFMLAMLLSALLTIPTARRADRAFEQFRRGDLLARWEYSPDFWLPYVEAETHRLKIASRGLIGIFFVPFTLVALFIGYSVPRNIGNKIELCAVLLAGMTALSAGCYAIAKAVVRLRRNALLNCPRAYIGSSAIYCGGIFGFWGSQMLALQSVRLLPGHTPEHPGVLEFIIGLSTTAHRAAIGIDVATMLAMRPAYASSYSTRQVIPVPPGQELRAGEIVGLLRAAQQPPPHVSSHPAPPVAVAPTKTPHALSGAHHDPRSLHRHAVPWLVLTLVLLFGGLGLFLLAMPLDYNRAAGADPSSLATLIEVTGLLAWVLSPATLIMSIVQWLRSRRARILDQRFSVE